MNKKNNTWLTCYRKLKKSAIIFNKNISNRFKNLMIITFQIKGYNFLNN